MKKELTSIIITLMKLRDDYYDEDIVKGIESLRNNWPNLTLEEKKKLMQ